MVKTLMGGLLFHYNGQNLLETSPVNLVSVRNIFVNHVKRHGIICKMIPTSHTGSEFQIFLFNLIQGLNIHAVDRVFTHLDISFLLNGIF